MAVAKARVRDRIVRRQGILKAAAGVFIRGGYRATTMEDVASAAGIGVGTLYHYFRGKEQLFASILAEANEILGERLKEAAAKKLPATFGLAAIARAYVDYMAEYPEYFRLLMAFQQDPAEGQELSRERQKIEKLSRRNLELFAEKIRQGQEIGIFRASLDPMATATALWASYNGILFAAMNPSLLSLAGLSAERLLSANAALHFSGLATDPDLAPAIVGGTEGDEVSLSDLQGIVRTLPWVRPAAIFSGMRMAFRSETARGIREVYRFELSGARGGTWTVRVDDGTIEVFRGEEGPEATVVLRMTDQRFVDLTTGEVTGLELVVRGEMQIEGDLQRAAMFSGFFLEGGRQAP